ncbi:DNA polymerase III subunit delta' [Amorphus orientalis]|uniref:DNA polymerase-3 subunit delta n=1 Tax=Amorphus orientalis TaxID=649198 RepID=A0AAE4AUI4_9HYPH|nr:DNA polymerase III subunit delta' [Amorphus orientalis]MDQ0315869.1 DNA polymerase-3 subunit delta' [Amorphus orientalis]
MARATTKADDPPPEPDQVGDWPVPRHQTVLHGHHQVEEDLIAAYRGGRLHHALLLTGPEGIGKATLAFRFARFVLAHPDPADPALDSATDLSIPETHPVFRQVATGAHPGLLHLRRPYDDKTKKFRGEITVDEVRRIVPYFGSTSAHGGYRIVIVDVADDLNVNAANALLKSLEEPPRQALFLLVCHVPGRLLPTIRSRCRRIDLRPLSGDQMKSALVGMGADKAHDSEAVDVAADLADGSLRRALTLLEAGGVGLQHAVTDILSNLPRLDEAALHRLADRTSGPGSDATFDLLVDLVSDWLSKKVRADATTQPPAALAGWAEVWEKTAHAVGVAEAFNLDRKQVVLNLFHDIAEVDRTARARAS